MNLQQRALAAFEQRIKKEAWLENFRQQALERFIELGLPTDRDEDWKYTSFLRLQNQPFHFMEHAPLKEEKAVQYLQQWNLPSFPDRLVFLNGHYCENLSNIPTTSKTMFVGNLSKALKDHSDQLQMFLTLQHEQTLKDSLASLNLAMLQEGAVIMIPSNTVLSRPLHILHLYDEAQAIIQPYHFIVLGENVKLTLIEHHIGNNDLPYFANISTNVICKPQAEVNYYQIQQVSQKAFHLSRVEVLQEKASSFRSQIFSLTGLWSRTQISLCANENTHTILEGLSLAKNLQHIDHRTLIQHQRVGGNSRQCYRGIFNGHARGVFTGKLIVLPNAQKTDAEQVNHNLLLSETTEADARPQLEIYADDVQCRHGATIGQLDEKQIFYLRTRGITLTEAKSILTYAFAKDMLNRVEQETLKNWLEKQIQAQLGFVVS